MKPRVCILLSALCCAACGGPGPEPHNSPAAPQAEAGFVGPPRLLRAERRTDGGVRLDGSAAPASKIRLATPDGRAAAAVADAKGGWSLGLPAANTVELYGLSAQAAGRTVQAEGYVAVTPPPGLPAAILRAGTGAVGMSSPGGPMRVLAVDIDASGAAVVSGLAPAGEAVSVRVDGQPAGEAGVRSAPPFTVVLARPLNGGLRDLTVQAGAKAQPLAFFAADPVRPTSGPYRAVRQDDGWRIDWMTPGGGLQTTLLLDPSGAGG